MILDVRNVPQAFDGNQAQVKYNDFIEQTLNAGLTELSNLIKTEEGQKLLLSIFGNSPYLTKLIFRGGENLTPMLTTDLDLLRDQFFENMRQDIPDLIDRVSIMKALRQAKAYIALLTAIADITESWSLLEITQTLSDFAILATQLTVSHLLRAAMDKGDLAIPEHWPNDQQLRATPELAQNTGYFVLGMGKTSWGELNYSSDIDLIVLYDTHVINYTGKRSHQDCFIKLTQSLVKIMQEWTEDGYVFRTDLRLRPDPGATPVAISTDAAEIYYQSIGLNWERSAMIKARPIAGDIKAGQEFLKRLTGFVWRKHLDYAALQDIHNIKKQIHRHHRHGEIQIKGHDVKLGRGGIREIEFFAQIYQLISGGREPSLRVAPTLDALHALEQSGKISTQDYNELKQSYIFLRRLEHRIQMVNDEQTHALPDTEEGVQHIATFMGYNSLEEFSDVALGHFHRVHDLYEGLLKDTHTSDADEDKSSQAVYNFNLDTPTPETLDYLEQHGLKDVDASYALIAGWFRGRYRACRTQRARDILSPLIPAVLDAFSKTGDADASLRKFDNFLSKLPSGVQLFSLINAHPWLLELLSEILSISPALAEGLSKHPLLLDAVLHPKFFTDFPDKVTLEDTLNIQLQTARDFQDVLDICRKWANEQKFQIGVQILRNTVDAATVGHALTNVADVVITALFNKVEEEFAIRHGRIAGASMAILALGKFGGRELTPQSDLDLVFIYDMPEDNPYSDGKKSLSTNHYYSRLSQNFINAITALTGEGRLYEVDMRLRPSGNAGPIAVSLDAFRQYQLESAWTWEHMALTRGRVCMGTPALTDKINQTVQSILCHDHRHLDNLLFETHKMRERLRTEFGTDNIWSLKHCRGGLVDVEFICQYLSLKHAQNAPDIIAANTVTAIQNLLRAGLMDPQDGEQLLQACMYMRDAQLLIRLCTDDRFSPQDAPANLKKALTFAMKTENFDEIEPQLIEAQNTVTRLYEEIIAKPAAEILPLSPMTPLGFPIKPSASS
ncbi:MAG: bifunctional [glutamate--ammonia ligase]-adenylyl-L-tyrosine phosphorylase/[glutamate--ammonia-ligase] adenylyltransferase [Kordiimonas sp.]|nr:bifunctional [glutamate--ammonia ligase]-adenylyl-L-tyrosine phosphorylase/[glutamate--ammonia-ligase] adenylyltransferase [Kordiimonas sp.]|tara:strand:+ start:2653 stop:5691 length:3039 start_codon:yes stop_codon:yes gene_type:complete